MAVDNEMLARRTFYVVACPFGMARLTTYLCVGAASIRTSSVMSALAEQTRDSLVGGLPPLISAAGRRVASTRSRGLGAVSQRQSRISTMLERPIESCKSASISTSINAGAGMGCSGT